MATKQTIAELTADVEKFFKELSTSEKSHDAYRRQYRDVKKQQDDCLNELKHLKYVHKQISNDIKRLELDPKKLTDDEKLALKLLRDRIKECSVKFLEMDRGLPATTNGLYLNIILGSNLDVSILNADDRYRYKQGYESFKARVTYVILAMFFLALVVTFRPMDAACNFLLVWYYCTLTIRESILRVNGSRIKGWWLAHHYISCVLCGINLTWTMSNSEWYDKIRATFIWLVIYTGLVQLSQTRYQTGCLRRLHALGQRHPMDITVEGFMDWMFKGLTFLLPFLLLCYVFQGYTAYLLFDMYFQQGCQEWQVIVLAVAFTLVAIGNILTTAILVVRKCLEVSRANSLLKVQVFSKYREKTC